MFDMIANNSSMFWLQLCQVQFSVAFLHLKAAPAEPNQSPQCVTVGSEMGMWDWLPRMGSGSSFQLSQAANKPQDSCSVKCSPTECCVWGGIKIKGLFPSEVQDFPERRKSGQSHQQLSLSLPCHCSEQETEAQVVFASCGFVEKSAFLSASI